MTGRDGEGPARLAIEDLSKSFAGVPALRELSLTVQAGELVTLLGPSGCGKSTTLRLIAGLESPDAGAIRIDGMDVSAQSVPGRNVGLVFQRYALFQHMTVRANVGFGLRVRGVARVEADRRVDEMLAVVGLEGLAERFPPQLSGGQMQRVALARTLVTRPRVLMLDEPFAALDAELRARMRIFLRKLQQKLGLTAVFVTHDQTEAMEMSDRIAVMQAGRLLQVDMPEKIYSRPCCPDVARMFGGPNLLPAVRTSVDGRAVLDAGFFDIPVPDTLADDGEVAVELMVRPEAVGISPQTSGPAVVADLSYLGKTVLYTVSAGARTIRVERPSAEPRLAPGQPVSLKIDPDAAWVFPRAAVQPSPRKI